MDEHDRRQFRRRASAPQGRDGDAAAPPKTPRLVIMRFLPRPACPRASRGRLVRAVGARLHAASAREMRLALARGFGQSAPASRSVRHAEPLRRHPRPAARHAESERPRAAPGARARGAADEARRLARPARGDRRVHGRLAGRPAACRQPARRRVRRQSRRRRARACRRSRPPSPRRWSPTSRPAARRSTRSARPSTSR